MAVEDRLLSTVSIRQKAFSDVLPDFRNLGVIARDTGAYGKALQLHRIVLEHGQIAADHQRVAHRHGARPQRPRDDRAGAVDRERAIDVQHGRAAPAAVGDLMDALRKSLAQQGTAPRRRARTAVTARANRLRWPRGQHRYTVATLLELVYLSAMTFTTVGYGDVSPVGPIRFLAGTEALVGFMLITWSASFTYLHMARHWREDEGSA